MQKFLVGGAALLLFSGLSMAKDRTFRGEIMDSQCASMGSHADMEKAPGMKGARDCTLSCVKMGGKFVLYNAATKTVYQLDDQKKPQRFAGQKVTVTGTLDEATKTLHVSTIKAST